MDAMVLAAIAKWPNVPAVFGWLRLDARGQWRMRDERAQQLALPGDPIRHPALLAFIVGRLSGGRRNKRQSQWV